jgi:hypothetical protein
MFGVEYDLAWIVVDDRVDVDDPVAADVVAGDLPVFT